MTSDAAPAEKRMKLRYPGQCRLCGAGLSAGAEAIYERDSRTVRCSGCPPTGGSATGESLSESGVAGASARREFERRRDSREQRIRAAHPKLGGLILALSDDPQSTQSWQQGARGEELMAARLAELPDSFQVLHDRRIPGGRANIDHLVVGASGVWVIDAKRYKNKRPELRVDGGVFRPRVESLRIGGRDGSSLVRGVQSQVSRVAAALDDETVPVHRVLCFLEADWPLIGGSFTVDDIYVTWPRALMKRMTQPGESLGASQIDAIHATLAKSFPMA